MLGYWLSVEPIPRTCAVAAAADDSDPNLGGDLRMHMVLEIRMVSDGTELFGGNEEKLSRIMRFREEVSSA